MGQKDSLALVASVWNMEADERGCVEKKEIVL